MAAILVVAVIVLVSSTYTKNETVAGVIVPNSGLVRINPVRPGKLVGLPIAEGEKVQAGQPVAKILVSESLNDGSSRSERISTSLSRQDERISDQALEKQKSEQF